jgi:hypothetical protein
MPISRSRAILRRSVERQKRADLRFYKKIAATRKLLEAGNRLVDRLSVENRQLSREVREVSRIQKAMLRFHTNGKNGHN